MLLPSFCFSGALQDGFLENEIDIFGVTDAFRQCRQAIIQTKDQYFYAYKAVRSARLWHLTQFPQPPFCVRVCVGGGGGGLPDIAAGTHGGSTRRYPPVYFFIGGWGSCVHCGCCRRGIPNNPFAGARPDRDHPDRNDPWHGCIQHCGTTAFLMPAARRTVGVLWAYFCRAVSCCGRAVGVLRFTC